MCTAITYRTNDFYFGRTLDYERSYGEEVVITPRNYPFVFRQGAPLQTHYAMIGMAHVADDYPLYYDAVNEKGLGVAGLNFVGNACYRPAVAGKVNIAQFEWIPYLLGTCASVAQARERIQQLNLTDTPFCQAMPPAELHWLIADRNESITLESVQSGLRVYDNPAGVLTNNPPFDEQLFALNHYMHVSPREPENLFSAQLDLRPYSRGMGALGLPGDLSSQSRFVRAAFTKLNAVCDGSESQSVSQFFHILGSVAQSRGCCILADGDYEITLYTSCCNADKGIYYYTTYGNHRIAAVDMHRVALDAQTLYRYPLVEGEQIDWQN